MNEQHSDVTLVVENTRIPAHKTILMARSPYFDSLFNGGFSESNQTEIKLEVQLEPFKEVLRYIYTGRLLIIGLGVDKVFDLCILADLYGFEPMKKFVLNDLITNVSMYDCCTLLDAASSHSFDTLENACLKFMDENSTDLLDDESFKTISINSLCNVLKRDTFYAPEIEIFKAVQSWLTHNMHSNIRVS